MRRRTVGVSAVWDPAGTVVQPRPKVELGEQGWSATAVTRRCDEHHTFSTDGLSQAQRSRRFRRPLRLHATDCVSLAATAESFQFICFAEGIRLIALS